MSFPTQKIVPSTSLSQHILTQCKNIPLPSKCKITSVLHLQGFKSEDGGSMSLRNVYVYQQVHTALKTRRQKHQQRYVFLICSLQSHEHGTRSRTQQHIGGDRTPHNMATRLPEHLHVRVTSKLRESVLKTGKSKFIWKLVAQVLCVFTNQN
jgi:hypothetical protein